VSKRKRGILWRKGYLRIKAQPLHLAFGVVCGVDPAYLPRPASPRSHSGPRTPATSHDAQPRCFSRPPCLCTRSLPNLVPMAPIPIPQGSAPVLGEGARAGGHWGAFKPFTQAVGDLGLWG